MSNFHYCKDNEPNKLDLYAKNIECDSFSNKGDVLILGTTGTCGVFNVTGVNSTGDCVRDSKQRTQINGLGAKKMIREYSVQFECVTTASTPTFTCDFSLNTENENVYWWYNHLDVEASNNEYQGYTINQVGSTVTLTIDINVTFAQSDARWTFQIRTYEDL